jgi:predicted dehydrogenase
MKKILNFGVLGAAKIARTHLIPAINLADGASYWGVASRNLNKAQAFASQVGFGVAVEGYEALLSNAEVQVIYNPLPNDLHVPLSIAALKAGKHVLCEKPLALNVADAKSLRATAEKYPHLKVMEGFMYRFHPQWQKILEWINADAVGTIKNVTSQFCYNNQDPANIRNNPLAGGGALMDVGCYGISATRMVLAMEPQSLVASMDIDPRFLVDNSTRLIMSFADGVGATVLVSTKTQRSQSMTIEGTKGRILVTHPFYCDAGDKRVIALNSESATEEFTFHSDINQYQLMVEAFVRSINLNTSVPLSLDDSIANMTVIDAAFSSVSNRSWIEL